MENDPIPVLIVDDDPTMTVLLKGLLRNPGGGLACTVTAVATGAAAREELRLGHYQLVLLDYQLPDDDGLALLDVVSAQAEHLQPAVIMLTGAGSEQVAVEAMKRGAKDYLVKNAMNLPALRRAILGALERKRLEARLAESSAALLRQNAQMEADLAMAREVQQALLPQHYPVFPAGVEPARSPLQFSQRWIPSHKVAGDFFTIFPVSDHQAGVFICDVMGHGVRAALVTALLRGLLREQQALAATPGTYLGEINRELKALLERAGELVYVTALYLVADATTGQVEIANAGHPAPLHLGRKNGRVARLTIPNGPGPALGLIPDALYDAERHRLEAGDALLLFTDGIYEAEGLDGDEFGVERMRKLTEANLTQPSSPLLETILFAVRKYHSPSGAEALGDDVCLVTVDYRPEAG